MSMSVVDNVIWMQIHVVLAAGHYVLDRGLFTVLGVRAKYREALIHEKVAAWEKEREEGIKQAGETSIPVG